MRFDLESCRFCGIISKDEGTMEESQNGQTLKRREEVTEKLRKLAEVSKELERYANVQSKALNVMQAKEAKRHVDELTVRQNDLVLSIVDMHPDRAVRENFMALTDKIESYRPKIRICQDPEELKEIKESIDRAVDEWVKCFQDISCYLAGVSSPK